MRKDAEAPEPEEPDGTPDTPTMFEMLGTMIDGVDKAERMKRSIEAVEIMEIERARVFNEEIQGSNADRLAATSSVRFESTILSRRSFITEISLALHIPESTAQDRILTGKFLFNQLPATLDALGQGSISYRHAQIMVDQCLTLDDESIHAFEEKALPKAQKLTVSKFLQAARELRERMNPESIAERNRLAFDDRKTSVDSVPDGMAWYALQSTAPNILGIEDRVNRIAEHLKRQPDETRTLTQLRSDVAAQLLLVGDVYDDVPSGDEPLDLSAVTSNEGAAAHGTTIEGPSAAPTPECAQSSRKKGVGRYAAFTPTVFVTVPVLSMLGKSDELPTLEGYGPISIDMATELAANAPSFIRLLTHPETGAVLSVGRDRYRPPSDLRTWIQVRNPTCVGVNCGRPSKNCDIDHTIAWEHAGVTSDDNLAPMCSPHHTGKHAKLTDGTIAADGTPMTLGEAWSVDHERDELGRPTGVLIWKSPTGHEYRSEPARRMASVPRDVAKRAAKLSKRSASAKSRGRPPSTSPPEPSPYTEVPHSDDPFDSQPF